MRLARLSWTSLTKILAALGLISASVLTFAATDDCDLKLAPRPVKFEAFQDTYIRADGVVVTGDFLYPLATVLSNFDLPQAGFAERYKGRTALTIAEGVSEFLPFLLRNGVKAKAIDVWYHTDHFPDNFSGGMMREYIEKYGPNLVQGSAEDIPEKDNSIDLIFIHMLLNNRAIDFEKTKRILSEVIRVLKPGEEDARIVGFKEDDIPLIRKFLTEKYGSKIAFEFKERHFQLGVFAGMDKESDHLLIIKK